MARATHITISTADRIRLDAGQGGHDATYDEAAENRNGENEIRQEVQVSVTYALDPGDTNLVALAERKALEVKLAHEAVWNRIGAFSGSSNASVRKNGFGHSLGGGSGRHKADDDTNDNADQDGENDRLYEDGPDDDPFAGLPQDGDNPFGGGPTPASSARPCPAAMPHRGMRNGNGCPEPAPEPDVQKDIQPDAEPVTGPQKILIRSRAGKIGLSAYALEKLLYEQFKVWRVERLTKAQAASVLVALERDLQEKKDGMRGASHAGDRSADDHSGRAATA